MTSSRDLKYIAYCNDTSLPRCADERKCPKSCLVRFEFGRRVLNDNAPVSRVRISFLCRSMILHLLTVFTAAYVTAAALGPLSTKISHPPNQLNMRFLPTVYVVIDRDSMGGSAVASFRLSVCFHSNF